ncbi:hypothetical protein [Marinigracilibium pacificum]|uniref:Uncharacterized protein n=1 Tax=Marinigracilibium pacificum TaxID=2729599 RepID=A0A848J3R5_9BACT|nr:hypothetical protein [Marinigracilibium pacificum]NMM48999.1 hypothetical protein [Marinigracilibium pacificum]
MINITLDKYNDIRKEHHQTEDNDPFTSNVLLEEEESVVCHDYYVHLDKNVLVLLQNIEVPYLKSHEDVLKDHSVPPPRNLI